MWLTKLECAFTDEEWASVGSLARSLELSNPSLVDLLLGDEVKRLLGKKKFMKRALRRADSVEVAGSQTRDQALTKTLTVPIRDHVIREGLKIVVFGIDQPLSSWVSSFIVAKASRAMAEPDALEKMKKRAIMALTEEPQRFSRKPDDLPRNVGPLPQGKQRATGPNGRSASPTPAPTKNVRAGSVTGPADSVDQRPSVERHEAEVMPPQDRRTMSFEKRSMIDVISEAGPFPFSAIDGLSLEAMKAMYQEFEHGGLQTPTGVAGRLNRLIWFRAVGMDLALLEEGKPPEHVPALTRALADAESALSRSSPGASAAVSSEVKSLARHVNRTLGVGLGTDALFQEMLAAVAKPNFEEHHFFGALLTECQHVRMPQEIVGALLGLHLVRAAAAHIEQAAVGVYELRPGASPRSWSDLVRRGEGLPTYVNTVHRTMAVIHRSLGIADPNTLKLVETLAFFDPAGRLGQVGAASAFGVRRELIRAAADGDLEAVRNTVVEIARKEPAWLPKDTIGRFADWSPSPLPIRRAKQPPSLRDVNSDLLHIIREDSTRRSRVIALRVEDALAISDKFLTRAGELCSASIAAQNPGANGKAGVQLRIYRLERHEEQVYPVFARTSDLSMTSFVQEVALERLLAVGRHNIDDTSRFLKRYWLATRKSATFSESIRAGVCRP